MTDRMSPQNWNAFAARVAAFGLPNALRGIVITGNETRLRRLNDFLRAEMPDMAQDVDALAWYATWVRDVTQSERTLTWAPFAEKPESKGDAR